MKTKRELELENANLRERLEEAESTLRAIHEGKVDAFVVSREGITQVLTLKGTNYLYRVFVESMNEGAVTLIPDGTIFYTNQRFAEMVQKPFDQFRHAAGDDYIKRVAEILKETFRADDIIARIGGDEFAVLLPNVDKLYANKLVNRIKKNQIKQNAVLQGLPLRFSLRVAAAEKYKKPSAVLRRADHEMYSNKQKQQRR